MPLSLQVDAGGEIYISYAKKKLAEMKAWMIQSKLRTFTKRVFISDTDQILINSTLLQYGQSLDVIRIASGIPERVLMLMPNPVPYRGLTMAPVDNPPPIGNMFVISATDGQVLREVPMIDIGSATPFGVHEGGSFVGSHEPGDAWPGDTTITVQSPPQVLTLDSVPEDAIYPTPTDRHDDAVSLGAFNLRRVLWLKKNSDEVTAALKVGFAAQVKDANGNLIDTPGVTRAELKTGAPPISWVPVLQDGATRSLYAARSTLIVAEVSDVVISVIGDVTETERTATLQYAVPTEPEPRKVVITGRRVRTRYAYVDRNISTGAAVAIRTFTDVYTNWFVTNANTWFSSGGIGALGAVSSIEGEPEPHAPGALANLGGVLNGLVEYGTTRKCVSYGYGVLPSGDAGFWSVYGRSSEPLPNIVLDSGVVVSIPAFVTQWRKDTKVEYKVVVPPVNPGTLALQNDSAQYGITKIEITPIGAYPEESLGVFPAPLLASFATTGGEKIFTAQEMAQQQTSGLDFTITGVLVSNATFVVSNTMNPFAVSNSATGAFTVTFKTAGGAGVVIPEFALLYADGGNVVATPLTATAVSLAQTSKVNDDGTTTITTTASTGGIIFATVTDGIIELPAKTYLQFTGALSLAKVAFTTTNTLAPTRVVNSTTGSFTLTLKTQNGKGVVIPRTDAPAVLLILADGTDAKIFGTGPKVELYGTASYNFDWQTGALTFSGWRSTKDTTGKDAPKIVQLPAGTVLGSSPLNCLITYKGAHWPDVATALKARDEALLTSTGVQDSILNALIKAVKAI